MGIKVDRNPENADWSSASFLEQLEQERQFSEQEDAVAKLLKHRPGGVDHDQSEHGNWSSGQRMDELEGGARLLQPGKGERQVSGEKVATYLTDENGAEVPYSHQAILETYGDGAAKYASSIDSVSELYGVELDQIEPRIDQVYQSALATYDKLNASAGESTSMQRWMNELVNEAERLRAHPWQGGTMPAWAQEYVAHIDGLGTVENGQMTWGEGAGDHLYELDRFYQRWNAAFSEEAAFTSISMDRIAAGASAISPSLKGSQNLLYASDMARMVAANQTFSDDQAQRAVEAMQARIMDHDAKRALVESQLKKDGSPRKYRSDWIQERNDLQASVDAIQSGERSFNNLNGMGMAYTGQVLRKDLAGTGFGTPAGYANYGKAYDVLTGRLSPNDVLGEVKTRSFANNAMDPDNFFDYDDVTIDFHALDMGGFMVGSDTATALSGTPAINGVGLGLRAAYADAFRSVARNYDTHGSHIQQITWGEWQRGKDIDSLVWRDADGNAFDLHEINGGKGTKGIIIPKGEKR